MIANSGLGFGLAAQLLKKGTYHVLLGSRTTQKGNAAVQSLQSQNLPGTVELVEVDVTSDDAINKAFELVEKAHGKLDVLINNAAVAVPPGTPREQLRLAFDTNATGPYVLTSTFAPLLQKSTSPLGARIINISSGVGSIGRRLDPTSAMYKAQHVQYRASKTALNMITACQFVEYGELGIKVFAFDPGFTVSNLSDMNKAENGARSAEDSADPIVDVIEGKRDDEAGKFLHNTGIYPW